MSCPGTSVRIDDRSLWVVDRGPADGFPLIVLHGGPGLDHHEFADYLDPVCDDGVRLLLVDQRAQGRSEPTPPATWTLERMAQDVIMLALALKLRRYAVLGHSYGAFVALQNAVDYPGQAVATVVSGGVASVRDLEGVADALASFEPEVLREQVASSWERESSVTTPDEVERLLHDQMPFHFRDPTDPRIEEYERRSAGAVYAPEVLRHFATAEYGGIELEDRLVDVTQPVLVLAGRHDRVCPADASERMAQLLPKAELHVFEQSAHMTFVEEPDRYLEVLRGFLTGSR
ncbi:MAG: alpha/beta fold hydrolase [Actinomycetota bacterium]|nr:alpha/beta fold hydrolase [Actinomycetota bacterium]